MAADGATITGRALTGITGRRIITLTTGGRSTGITITIIMTPLGAALIISAAAITSPDSVSSLAAAGGGDRIARLDSVA
jgi:hypothetical protein